MFVNNSFLKKIFVVFILATLFSGSVSAFQLMNIKVTPKLPYYVKLAGAGYIADKAYGENTNMPEEKFELQTQAIGASVRLKDGSIMEFAGIYYDCYPTAGEKGFVASFIIYNSDANLQNKKNELLKSKAVANLKLGEKIKSLVEGANSNYVPGYEFELIEFSLPQVPKLTNSFLKNGTIIATMCKGFEANNAGWNWSWKNLTLGKYLITDNSFLTKFKTIHFIKPLEAYVILKVNELK